MKAVVCTQYGGPEVLRFEEVQRPVPRQNEVLIKIHAASVNSWDWDFLTGKPLIYRLLFGLLKPKFKILGADIAGTIEACGEEVKQFQLGNAVMGDLSPYAWGGFAEYVCVPEEALVLKSPQMTFEQAAAIPQAGVLALQGLRDQGKLQHGQQVLINGAGGGVGTFGVQIAKMYGAEVTVVDKGSKLPMLKSLGADYMVDYTREDFTKSGKSYDLILDVVGSRSVFDFKRILKPNGRYVMVGGPVGRILKALLVSLWSKGSIGILMHKPNQMDLRFLNSLFESQKLAPVIDGPFAMAEVPKALAKIGAGNVLGKAVIKILKD